MAKGSHATRANWQPRNCHHCGNPVRVTRDTCWFHYSYRLNEGFSIHMQCQTRIDWKEIR